MSTIRPPTAGGAAPHCPPGGAHEEYDPAADIWRSRARVPTPRNHLTAVTVGSDIYLLAGRVGGRNEPVTEIYDSRTDRWRRGAPIPTSRSGSAAAVVGQFAYVFGGELGRPSTYRATEAYEFATNTWSARAPMPTPRHGLAAVAGGARIYVIRGGPRPGGSY